MKSKESLRISAVLLCAAALLAIALPASASAYPNLVSGMPEIETEASAMALIEANTGTLLAEQNADQPLPMASTTKIMTALIVIENCGLDELVSVDDSAVGVEGSSMHLERGERVTVRDLLYGLMLASGNDAAVALAIHVSGSVEAFAGLMNARAEGMGLTKTRFVTPNGLTAPGHQTTAYELCIIAAEAMKNETFAEIASTKYHTTASGAYTRTFKNKNSMLWDYDGALGVKTGYTMAAGRCLVFAAERDGMTVIGALLNCRPMFQKAALLLDAAFNNYAVCTVIPAGDADMNAEVKNGIQRLLAVEVKNSIIAVVSKDAAPEFSAEYSFFELYAPVYKGDTVGEVTLYKDGVPVGSSPLIAAETVGGRGLLYWFMALAKAFA